MSFSFIFTDTNRPFVLCSNGNPVHWSTLRGKVCIEEFRFLLKLETILPFTFSGVIKGIYLFFESVFRIDQYARFMEDLQESPYSVPTQENTDQK